MKDTVIKPSDKGGWGDVVVWPMKLYEREALWQLRDTTYYKWLSFNPLQKYYGELKDILDKALEIGTIMQKQFDCLLPNDSTISTFYLFPQFITIRKN